VNVAHGLHDGDVYVGQGWGVDHEVPRAPGIGAGVRILEPALRGL